MKSVIVTLALVSATSAFAKTNCVSEMMAGPAHGNLDQAQAMCRTSEKVCNVSEIVAKTGLNYASAMELCAHKLESNAALIACITKGFDYSYCAQQH